MTVAGSDGVDFGPDFGRVLTRFVSSQPWFQPGSGGLGTMAGISPAAKGDPGELPPARITESEILLAELPALIWLAVELDGDLYQLLVGVRAENETAQLRLRDTSVLGPVDGPWGHGLSYDALADPELSLSFLDLATDMAQSASRVRRIGLEKSNSCLVYDDRLIIKIFRRLHAGRNPEAVLAITLDEVGFNHVATPISVWRKDPFDLALVREFLPGGTDGWALALTSLRDLFSRGGAPELAGGDFGAEARRLGEMTSKLHLALAQAFGSDPARGGEWVHGVQESLTRVSADGNARSAQVVDELGRLGIAGCSIPIHGDYHLGRVMRTEVGWYVLDLEGDPSRPLDERHERLSPLKDVAAMLRSFEYATVAAVRERGPAESAELAELPAAWERRNRAAFLDGYLGLTDIYRLVPADTATFELVLEAFELEKAARELAFELAYRPWRAPALRAALDRLLAEQQPS